MVSHIDALSKAVNAMVRFKKILCRGEIGMTMLLYDIFSVSIASASAQVVYPQKTCPSCPIQSHNL